MDKIEILIRIFYRAFVVAMLIFIYDNKQIWGFPFGLLIGLLTEAKALSE